MSNRIVPENTVKQNPRDPNFVLDPYAVYKKWHDRKRPVYWSDYGFWCLFSFDAVNRVLRDRRFARLPPIGHAPPPVPEHLKDFALAEKYSLLAMEPPAHTRLRQLVNRAFVSRQTGRLAPTIEAMAHACIDKFEAEGTVELLEHYATPIPLNVITRLLGVSAASGPELVAWSHAMVKVYTLSQTHEEEILANRAAAEFQEFLRSVIAEKRNRPGDDLLSHMLTIKHDTQPITDEEIISVTILLLNAGHEASVHQLGNAVHTLLQQYPGKRRAKLLDTLADTETADNIVAECLRFAAPLHLFTRYAQEDLTLAEGVHLASGDQVGLLLAAANRCPTQFQQPDAFNPGRADAAHLSLGAGIHYCVGAHLSRLELRIALQVLFKRLPALELLSLPKYQNAFHFHGLQSLHVRW
ncbi:MAG: cytochrome P450 [Granulosicoccus sp.]